MARQIEKCRLCRREGRKLFLKGARCSSGKCPIDKKGAQPPGMHGTKRTKRLSSYGIQLREKQKVKRMYGMLEAPFHRLFTIAKKHKTATGEALLVLLERRLDNIVYKLNLAPSKYLSRQLITHGHVLVDGKKLAVPSYLVTEGQTVSLTPKGKSMVAKVVELAPVEQEVPLWLKKEANKGTVLRFPERKELDPDINENLIVEFYSR